MKKRVLFTALLVVFVLLAVAPIAPVVAAPPQAWEPSDCPYSWAAKPCSRQWISVTTYNGYKTSVGCVDLSDNPAGYYKMYTKYSGWWYKDAKGVTYYGWFNSVGKGAVVGPLTIVNKFSWTECGIP